MTSIDALVYFLRRFLDPQKSARYCDLIQRPKGQKRFMSDLYHRIGNCFRADISRSPLTEAQRNRAAFSYSEIRGFGVCERSLEQGYEMLMPNTGWLLIDAEGTFGIYQPEDMIDDQLQIQAEL